jgi:acyl-CoA reductase-like NAD-dependent aldehyde dehydrogenase
MQIFGEQLRGPAVRVMPFDTDEEALSLANAARSLTAAYIWTADLQRARRLAPDIESTSTWVNSHNPLDLVATACDVNIGFYTQTRTTAIAANDTPVPPFGT